jgi:hypothetical protein
MNAPETDIAEVDLYYPKLRIESVVDAIDVELQTVGGEAFKTLAKMSPLANKISVFAPSAVKLRSLRLILPAIAILSP